MLSTSTLHCVCLTNSNNFERTGNAKADVGCVWDNSIAGGLYCMVGSLTSLKCKYNLAVSPARLWSRGPGQSCVKECCGQIFTLD